MSADDSPGTREVARRLFAAEYDDATLSYSESDEERAPNYVVTPTGLRVNRLFVVGVLTATESVNEEMLRARIADPTGVFVAYAGQYQPDALAAFERTTPPEFLAVTGKARTFQPDDSEQVFTSVRPESVNPVDSGTRDRWTVSAARATLRRVSLFDAALDSGLTGERLAAHLRANDVEEALATGIPRAIDHYGTTTAYLDAVRRVALDALAVVAGDRDDVRSLEQAPDEGESTTLGTVPASLRASDAIATPKPEVDATSDADSTSAPDPEQSVSDSSTDPSATANEPSAAAPESSSAADAADTTATADASTEPGPTAEASDERAAETPAEGTTETSAEDATVTSTEDETTSSTGEESETPTEELGDFDASPSTATTDSDRTDESDADPDAQAHTGNDEPAPDADAEVSEDDFYEFDDEEREAIREEHGLSFESGSAVDSPGEAGIETPDPEASMSGAESAGSDTEPAGASSDPEPGSGAPDPDTTDASADVDSSGESAEDAFDGDLTDLVVDVMAELDGGDGADRDEVVAAVVDRIGSDPDVVDDAIQDALMDGKCYEPGEDRLKAI